MPQGQPPIAFLSHNLETYQKRFIKSQFGTIGNAFSAYNQVRFGKKTIEEVEKAVAENKFKRLYR